MSKGIKLNNNKSTVPPPPSTLPAEEFQKAADAAAERIFNYKERAGILGLKLKSLIESNILPENKTLVLKDFEKEVLENLIRLANDLNNDETQQEGAGSIALSQLIMKMMLLQRDHINKLQFKIENLEKLVQK